MRAPKKLRPQFERLESLALLSGMGATVHTQVTTQNPPPVIIPAPLTGTINGTYSAHRRSAPAEVDYSFFGVGRLAPIGTAALNGIVHRAIPIGSVATGLNGSNALHLHGRRGSLTLQVTTATAAADMSPGHFTFTYVVSAATGAYQGEQGQAGAIDVSVHSFIPSFVRPDNFDVGRFTMTFSTVPTA